MSNAGKIAGSKVLMVKLKVNLKQESLGTGKLYTVERFKSIFREKNQVKQVGTGLECGISIKDFIDFKEKDVIESLLVRRNSKVNLK